MTSTTRIQNRYDHLLREHVRSTGDVNYAIQLGVLRSTARGWVNSTPAEVDTLDVVDMDNVRLQQQVLRLQSRLDWAVAVLRLVIVVLKASDISLSSVRIPEGTAKLMLLLDFVPERWEELAERGRVSKDMLHFGFSHGPRVCPENTWDSWKSA